MTTRRLLMIGRQGEHDEHFVQSLVAGGYIVLQSSDVQGGIEIVGTTVPDVILVDIDLLDRRVDELSADIATIARARIPIILIVGRNALSDIEGGADVAGFVTKPVDAIKLMVHLGLLFQFCERTGALTHEPSPKKMPAAVASDAGGDRVDVDALKGKRVLIIDDDHDMVQFLADVLNKEGMIVESAYDGGEGLAKAQRVKPDVILLDIMMPEMDGYQVCRLMKFDERYRHIPILILTALGDEGSRAKAIEVAGADGYVSKPFQFSELIHVMKNAVGGDVYRTVPREGA